MRFQDTQLQHTHSILFRSTLRNILTAKDRSCLYRWHYYKMQSHQSGQVCTKTRILVLFFFVSDEGLTATQLDNRVKSLNQTAVKQTYSIYTATGFTLKHLSILSYCVFESYLVISCLDELRATEVNTIFFFLCFMMSLLHQISNILEFPSCI